MSDIVERLRSVFAAGPTHGTWLDPVPDPLCHEAASLIEQQAAEIERLRALLGEARQMISRAATLKLADGTYFDKDCRCTFLLGRIDAAIAEGK